MCTALLIIIIYNSFKKNRVKIYAYIMHLVVARHTYYLYLLMKIIKMGLYIKAFTATAFYALSLYLFCLP